MKTIDFGGMAKDFIRALASAKYEDALNYSPAVFTGDKANLHTQHNLQYAGSPNLQGYYQNFDRFYSIYNELELDSLTQYVFIVRPDLNIYDPDITDPYLKSMIANNSTIMKCLTDTLSVEHDFIPFLVGRTESIQMPDISIKNYSISQPHTNILMPYGGNMWESLTGGTFDITFREDKELRIHKMFQAWLYYIDGVSRDVFKPKLKYIQYNKYDYMCSVYYFVCQADGETLVWWNKYTGAFPTSVPNSDLSFNLRGSVETKVTIPFVYYMQDIPMNPYVLVDFNRNSAGDQFNGISGNNPNVDSFKASYLNSYDSEILGTRNGMFGAPFITGLNSSIDGDKVTLYPSSPKLRWRAPKTF